MEKQKDWDVFISHAHEDKDAIVSDLAKLLSESGLKVWYDEFSLQIGDSLIDSINYGLENSRYGIVVLSKDFLKKNWSNYELKILVTKQIEGKKMILPIWHNITKNEIQNESVFLSDLVALDTYLYSLDKIVLKLIKKIKPELYQKVLRHKLFYDALSNGKTVSVKLDQLKPQVTPQSKLSKQQILRVNNLHLVLGDYIGSSVEESISLFELDWVPENEIIIFEFIMYCFLQFVNSNPFLNENFKKEVYLVLLGLSLMDIIKTEFLNKYQCKEIIDIWNNSKKILE